MALIERFWNWSEITAKSYSSDYESCSGIDWNGAPEKINPRFKEIMAIDRRVERNS